MNVQFLHRHNLSFDEFNAESQSIDWN